MSRPHEFADLLSSVDRSKLPSYTDSQALLHWFLFNVFRLDEIESRDAICDGPNDKGIDGLWVDDDSEEIFLFQSKFTKKHTNGLGDSDLREFVGSASWFSNPANINALMAGQANVELKALVNRLDLGKKLQANYEVKLVFVSTRELDDTGNEFFQALKATSTRLDIWDQPRLLGQNKNLQRKTRVQGTHKFITDNPGFAYAPHDSIRAYVRPVRAIDIAKMSGIADRSLFSLNVRFGLGRTRVNRDLEAAVRETTKHNQFTLFHNGVTIICKTLKVRKKDVKITDYSVVNGCQSAIAFYDNVSQLTDKLQVIAKFIEVGDNDALADDITYRSNNQNGINLRDLKSNDRIQIALRKQFETKFGGKIEYVIKAGDDLGGEAINNVRAGQWLMALYLDEGYNAHQKYRVFGPEYERIFSREIDADKIYLSYLVFTAVESVVDKVDEELIRGYQLTKLILLSVMGTILRIDVVGKELLSNPAKYLPAKEEEIKRALAKFAALLIPDFNFYIKEKKGKVGYYDYKSAFKSADEYLSLSRDMQKNYEKAVIRHPEESFAELVKSS